VNAIFDLHLANYPIAVIKTIQKLRSSQN